MNYNQNKKSFLFLIIISFLTAVDISAQVPTKEPGDSLSLGKTIKLVISTYPSVKVAEEAIKNADARISLAKTGYYPEIDLTASFSNLGPVTRLTLPEFGTFQLYPGNNYSASVNYKQLLLDFGRTKQNVELENENKVIGEQTLEQLKQKLSLYTIGNFYSILYLQAAIKIKDEQITTLNEHLHYIEKVQNTGSATEYQVLTTKVRISAVESQKVDLVSALATQQASLNSLLGADQMNKPFVKNELAVDPPDVLSDSVINFALSNRDEILINKEKTSLAEIKYQLTRLQMRPLLSLQASGGAKNGYIPYLGRITPNYVVGLGLRVPIFDAMKTKYNLSQAQSAITSLSYESEITRRNISNEVLESEALMIAANTRVSQSVLQLQQAKKAYSLAETSFKSGMITNLDLLDANTSVSESSLMVLKAKIDYVMSIYKLKASLGERIY